MKHFLFTVFVVVVTSGCYNQKSRENFSGSQQINEEITREYYEVFGAGVWGEVDAEYLTDSTTFRAFIGTRDEHANYAYTITGDSILVEKILYEVSGNVVDTSYFLSISELKHNPAHKIE